MIEELLLRRVGGDVGHVQVLVGPALGVHQLLKGELCADAAVLPRGEPLLGQINVLVLDAPLLEVPLRLLGVKALGGAEDLNVHSDLPARVRVIWQLGKPF